MVVRTRFAAIVIPLLFHVFSGAVGGFFVWHAFHGERGIAADLETRREMAEVEAKLKVIRAEKADWQRRVDLLRGPGSIATCSTRRRATCSIASTRPTSS